MTGPEMRALLKARNWPPGEAAKRLKVSRRTLDRFTGRDGLVPLELALRTQALPRRVVRTVVEYEPVPERERVLAGMNRYVD